MSTRFSTHSNDQLFPHSCKNLLTRIFVQGMPSGWCLQSVMLPVPSAVFRQLFRDSLWLCDCLLNSPPIETGSTKARAPHMNCSGFYLFINCNSPLPLKENTWTSQAFLIALWDNQSWLFYCLRDGSGFKNISALAEDPR